MNDKKLTPGEWLRKCRVRQSLSFRQLAFTIGILPSDWCNMENDRLAFPDQLLAQMASCLHINFESDQWYEFVESATVSRLTIDGMFFVDY